MVRAGLISVDEPASFFDFFRIDCFNFAVQTHVIQSDHDETFSKAMAIVFGSCRYVQDPGFGQIPTFHAPMPLQDTTVKPDDTLRIRNLNPYFSLHVDSTLYYQLEINRDPGRYFFFMKDAPVGMKIKENGLITFRADKSYFLSGRLKYDVQYKVKIGVQNLDNPKDRIDTSFTIQFFTTDVIPSRVKPTVSSLLTIDEGDTINFRVQCETGTYPIESINFFSQCSDPRQYQRDKTATISSPGHPLMIL